MPSVPKSNSVTRQPGVAGAKKVSGGETKRVSGGETKRVSGGETKRVSGGETKRVSGGGETKRVSGGETKRVSGGGETKRVSGGETKRGGLEAPRGKGPVNLSGEARWVPVKGGEVFSPKVSRGER